MNTPQRPKAQVRHNRATMLTALAVAAMGLIVVCYLFLAIFRVNGFNSYWRVAVASSIAITVIRIIEQEASQLVS